ncbi:Vascular endothelial growth factor receptor 2 [Orchesella cincta]|uniref:Vascular endothelial growth factor receptor 2 n=1 Tax=Orchesella cincta TaxID=48709 RepID=A0A1D2MX17_ORCCI|nr:Vascular endothelial growth factor receptor 2 [Orchesella cincta]
MILAVTTTFIGFRTLAYDIELYVDSVNDCNGNTRVSDDPKVITITSNGCTNLPNEFIGRVTGAKVNQNCTQFYDEPGCIGNSIQLSSLSPSQDNFEAWNFKNQSKSVGTCEDPCIPEEGRSVPIYEANRIIEVTLYEGDAYQGRMHTFNISGCMHLNKTYRYKKTLKSVKIPKGECVLAFLSDEEVLPNGNTEEDCIAGKDALNRSNVLEFRHGMPNLHYLPSWASFFPQNKYVKAISPCQCKPFNDSSFNSDVGNYIMFFEHSNFNGENCLDFSNTNYREWEGTPMSMNVSTGSCVEMYTDHNCLGSAHLEVTSQMEAKYLSDLFSFDRRIRSLRVCNKVVEEATKDDGLIVKESSINILKSPLMYSLLPVACICASLAFVLTWFLVRNRRQTKNLYKTLQEKLTEKEIDEFLQGLGLHLEDGYEEKESICENNEAINTEDDPIIPKLSSDLLAQNQPYNYQLEIPLTQLKFDAKYLIGSGEYGNVFKGTLEKSDEPIPVAIKTTKSNSNTQYLRALLKEVKVMMYVGHHSKIVALIGCSTVNLRRYERELFIVLEYCEKGSLENFLKANRSHFVNFVQRGQLQVQQGDPDSDYNLQSQPSNLSYVQVLPILDSLTQRKCSTMPAFDIRQLVTWTIEIADGMEYLAMKKVIHGDLSARNILLTSDLTAKVSDFGLSRKIYCYSQYTRNGEEPLPWRWLALESLKNLEFSTASDVWSFGILLWEIFTLGEQPYPGVSSLTNNFILNLEQGLRPVLPSFATCDIYNIMSCCWHENPSQRPTFTRLNLCLQEVQDLCESQLSS